MDIEKLIERLKWWTEECDRTNYGCQAIQTLQEAAAALSTLQIENQALRNAANGFKAENEKLRAELERCKEKNAGLALALLTECAPNPDCLGNDEWRAIRAELEQVKRTLAMMWFAYVNSDKEDPHNYETEALEEAERLLGPWKECMPKYLRRGQKED